MKIARGLTLAVTLVLVFTSAAGAFELEEVLSAPYPTGLVAAAGADRIAWVVDEKGVRNLWTAAAPGYEPVRLTDYTEDDGQTLGSLALTADGSLLVYVRGGGPNAAGETPNPSSDPEGAEQAIWAVATRGGEPWKIAPGAGPVLTPAGDRLVFSKGSQVLVAPLRPPEPAEEEGEAQGGEKGGDESPAPEPLFTARGSQRSLTFSPDGSRLAFVSGRGDHGFVGVFHMAEETITWIAPGVDRDDNPTWSPEGDRLAFIRVPGRKMDELLDLTSGLPFALWVADPVSGEARQVWHSPADDGGFAQYYPSQPLAWGAGDRLVFTSEHEGWLHLYAVPAAGGEAVDLTPGEAEVEGSTLAPDRRVVYASTNHGDRHRRHLWRVPVDGGDPVLLTPGQGIETDPAPLPGGGVAFRGADARRPQAIQLLDGGRIRRLAPAELPAGFPAGELVLPEVVSFQASDGLILHGELFLPAATVAGAPGAGRRRPAAIFLHGGPVRQMLQGWHYSHYYANAYAFNQYLASRGYVVLALNFRTGIGYGRAFRQAEGQGPRGASEYRDVIAAGLYLRQRPEVDPGAIGLWGGSYGGYLTAMGLARDSDLFAAGVDLHGVHDWSYRATEFPLRGGFWGLDPQSLDLARRSSPVSDLSYWSSPVLMIHGDDDRNVLFIQTTDLVQRLRERKVHVEVLIFPDEVHGFLRHESWLRAYRAAADFFARFLAGLPPRPEVTP